MAMAIRKIPLDRPDARRRFLREIDLLRKLRDACEQTVDEWPEVRRYVPLLHDAGLDEKDPNTAIVIYPWIEGHPLSGMDLGVRAVTTIGARLCLVLEKLHELEIVHSDIKPDNILLKIDDEQNDPFLPALIDFGLARLLDGRGTATKSTTGVAEYLPPEVLQDSSPGRWTPRGDVYSLGRSLLGCLTADQGPLRPILAAMTAVPVEHRWTASQARQAFARLESQLQKDQVAGETAREVDAIFAKFPPVVRKATLEQRELFRATLQGSFRDLQMRMLHAAAFLELAFKTTVGSHPDIDRLFQECRRDNPGSSTFLAMAPKALGGAKQPWSEFADATSSLVGEMRNAWAHPNDREQILGQALSRAGVRTYGASSGTVESRMRDAVLSVSRRLDRAQGGAQPAYEPLVVRWTATIS